MQGLVPVLADAVFVTLTRHLRLYRDSGDTDNHPSQELCEDGVKRKG